jgi:ABC-type glycerol-3-phosphate transport system substrate-binding protein
MRLIRLLSALLLLGLAACSTTTPGDSSTLLIDQPTPPYPYNSRICP